MNYFEQASSCWANLQDCALCMPRAREGSPLLDSVLCSAHRQSAGSDIIIIIIIHILQRFAKLMAVAVKKKKKRNKLLISCVKHHFLPSAWFFVIF
jgi:hypothetical protein